MAPLLQAVAEESGADTALPAVDRIAFIINDLANEVAILLLVVTAAAKQKLSDKTKFLLS